MPELNQIRRRLNLSLQPTAEDMFSAQTLHGWLQTQAKRIDARWLLMHSDVGVMWGKFDNDLLTLSHEHIAQENAATLDPKSLQRCYLFGPTSELFLWRVEDGWRTRVYYDYALDEAPADVKTSIILYYDEAQILSGTEKIGREAGGFTRTADGVEGLYHAVPLTAIAFVDQERRWRPLRLTVRHYIAEDEENGALYVATGRLVCLWQTSPEGNPVKEEQAVEEATDDRATA